MSPTILFNCAKNSFIFYDLIFIITLNKFVIYYIIIYIYQCLYRRGVDYDSNRSKEIHLASRPNGLPKR